MTLSTLLPWKPLASKPKRIKFSFSFGLDNDNLVNDSGTKLTLLPPDMYLQHEYQQCLAIEHLCSGFPHDWVLQLRSCWRFCNLWELGTDEFHDCIWYGKADALVYAYRLLQGLACRIFWYFMLNNFHYIYIYIWAHKQNHEVEIVVLGNMGWVGRCLQRNPPHG